MSCQFSANYQLQAKLWGILHSMYLYKVTYMICTMITLTMSTVTPYFYFPLSIAVGNIIITCRSNKKFCWSFVNNYQFYYRKHNFCIESNVKEPSKCYVSYLENKFGHPYRLLHAKFFFLNYCWQFWIPTFPLNALSRWKIAMTLVTLKISTGLIWGSLVLWSHFMELLFTELDAKFCDELH